MSSNERMQTDLLIVLKKRQEDVKKKQAKLFVKAPAT